MNSTLQSIVTDLSPALDVIQSQVPGGQQVSFSEIYLKQEVPPRVFQPYEPQFFLQFIQNLLNQIKQANINERDRADLNKVLAGLLMVIRTRSTDLQRQEVTKPGVSLGLEAASIEQYVSNIGPTISKLAQSEILATSLYGTLQSASMIAGLAAAGQNIKGLTSVMGISVAELFDELGINLNTFLEQQSTQALALAYSEQLALVAAQTTSLKQTAVNILSQIPGATSLTPDQVKELLATLLQFLQFLLMFMSMLMAALAGLGGAQFLTRIVGTIGGPPQQLLSALQTLGLPQEKAVALGVALGGKATDLQQILASMGLDPNASTLILALIGAQIGKVSLTQGVIGGPAFLDALLKKLSSYGITLTAQIGTDQFKKQLLDALQTKATSDQFSMLTDEINRMEQDVAGTKGEELSVEEITNELIDKVVADLAAASRAAAEQAAIAPAPVTPAITPAPPIVVPFAAPPAPPVTPPVTPPAPVAPIAITVAAAPIAPVTAAAPLPAPPAILPSDILAQYVTEFQKLPATAQAGLITLAKTQLTTIQGLTDEQKAALLIATRLGKTSVTEATTLAQLASMQTAGLVQYNDTITQAISRLFQESPEAKLAREDALKRAIVNEETRTKELLPNALPQRITDNISTSFKQVINNFDDKNLSLKIVDNFSKYVEKLSSFSKVGEMLLDPGKILLRLFSVLLTTSQDRIKRPPTLFGG
jgi:hypothetical protein